MPIIQNWFDALVNEIRVQVELRSCLDSVLHTLGWAWAIREELCKWLTYNEGKEVVRRWRREGMLMFAPPGAESGSEHWAQLIEIKFAKMNVEGCVVPEQLKPTVVLTGTAEEGRAGPPIGMMDIGVSEKAYLCRIALPGLRNNETRDGRVNIHGVVTGGALKESSTAYEMKVQQLCPPGQFTISFNLPGPVDPRLASLNFRSDGILEIFVKCWSYCLVLPGLVLENSGDFDFDVEEPLIIMNMLLHWHALRLSQALEGLCANVLKLTDAVLGYSWVMGIARSLGSRIAPKPEGMFE
ncbi:unnamed protein product [Camellia sinensis]